MTDKERFVELIRGVGRDSEGLIYGLEECGFFTAPASSKHHLAREGGLLAHSLNVYEQAMMIYEAEKKRCKGLENAVSNGNVTVASLLHDVCKADVYRQVEKYRKDAFGKWEKYLAYECNYASRIPIGHGEKSVVRVMQFGYALTSEEIVAIRYHMGGFELADTYESRGNFAAANEKTPLLGIIIAADELATWIDERKENAV